MSISTKNNDAPTVPVSVVARLILVAALLGAVHLATLFGSVRMAVAILFTGLAIGPAAGALGTVGRRRIRLALVAAGLIFVAAAAVAWPGLDGRPALLVPPFLGYLMTSAFFGWSLRPGHVPVIVRLSRISRRDPLPEGVEPYARAVTWGWAVLPAVLGVGALVVYLLFGLEAWSWVSNIGNPITLVAFFVTEHLYRAWRMPHLGKASLATTLDVMANTSAWRRMN
jgi:uncharacterized membrane protein